MSGEDSSVSQSMHYMKGFLIFLYLQDLLNILGSMPKLNTFLTRRNVFTIRLVPLADWIAYRDIKKQVKENVVRHNIQID